MLSNRLSQLSSDENQFAKAIPVYADAMRQSGHPTNNIRYTNKEHAGTKSNRQKKQNVIWFNPQYSEHVQNNIG